jgi:hypothetical protein
MMFVIQRFDNWFVANDTMAASYTPLLQRAKTWSERELAERVCRTESEKVISVEEAMQS